MKSAFKISSRERWFLAFAPSVLIVGVYLLGIEGNLVAQLQKEKVRAAAAFAPVQQSSTTPALTKAKADFDAVNRSIGDRKASIAQLHQQIDAVDKTITAFADGDDAAQVIGHVEKVFAHHGIKPLVSEAADEGKGAHGVPTALVDVFSPKTDIDVHEDIQKPRVWHLIFDDQLENFQRAMQDVAQEAPAVVPLSLNLVYNPDNDGQSRLLELWLLY